ncbi:MAG: exonuclease domain-containing protein [Proteobacteria bacterium]|nr:exonuclease domain-containing protein [Pseudomonadota bacterium]MDA0967464.1 exonuclease domain-containing protein [Pseudomonadota bacterium]MDG4548492.1 exonuclease domain-containing protein [Rickettsiales bacterium]
MDELQLYFNPEGKKSDIGAYKAHRISSKFLKDKPVFKNKAEQIEEFIGNNTVVGHNVSFDINFLNAEFERAGRAYRVKHENSIDTKDVAKESELKLASYKLDSICQKLGINLNERKEKGHGALLDAKLTAQVYFVLSNKLEQEDKYYNLGDKRTIAEDFDTPPPAKRNKVLDKILLEGKSGLNDLDELKSLPRRSLRIENKKVGFQL